ncbi:hypothetical protein ABPG74_003935 [Tetrahymena malaccensis]
MIEIQPENKERNSPPQSLPSQNLNTEAQNLCLKDDVKSLTKVEDIMTQEKRKGASVLNATANIVKSGLGTGILFMPYGFMTCGVVLSTLFMIITGIICYYCWSILGRIIRQKEAEGGNQGAYKDLTLERVAGLIFGDRIRVLLEVITLIFIYGTCIGYTIFIQQSISELISSEILIQVIVFAIYFPLSLFKRIQNLGIFSYLALTSFIFTITVIIIKSCYQIQNSPPVDFVVKIFDIQTLPLYFGVFAFAYDINGVITEVHASMEDKTKFDIVLRRYLIFSCSLAILIGMLGCFAFGNETNAVIFKSLGSMNGLGDALSCLYSFSLVASILLYGFPIVNCLDGLINKYIMRKQKEDKVNIVFMIFTRCLFFLSISFFGIYIQQITNVFNILGCVFSVVLIFIVPMLMFERQRRLKEKYVNQLQNAVQINITPEIKEEKQEKTIQTQNNTATPTENHFSFSENMSKQKFYFITSINYLVMIFGVTGGVSGLVSTIIDIQSQYS